MRYTTRRRIPYVRLTASTTPKLAEGMPTSGLPQGT
jgi:hypothetical protein